VGLVPNWIAVDHATGYLYVTNRDSGTVSVINSAHYVVGTIPVGSLPFGIAYNPNTHKLYVANFGSSSVSVIDTNTLSVIKTISLYPYREPSHVAINALTNRIYVTLHGDGRLAVIRGDTDTLVDTVETGAGAFGVAVYPTRNRIYVSNRDVLNISVIDGATNTKLWDETIDLGNPATVPYGSPYVLAINNLLGRLYVTYASDAPNFANPDRLAVYDISHSHNLVALAGIGPLSEGLAINEMAARVYVTSGGSDTLTIVDAYTNLPVLSFATGRRPLGVAANPSAGRIYVANRDDGTISIFTEAGPFPTPTSTPVVTPTATPTPAGLPRLLTTIPNVGVHPKSVATANNRVYVTLWDTSQVAVIDASTNTVITRSNTASHQLNGIAVSDGLLWAAGNASNDVAVLDAASNLYLTSLPAGQRPFGVSAANHRVYVANYESHTVTVIDSQTGIIIGNPTVGYGPTFPAAVGDRAYVPNHLGGGIYIVGADGLVQGAVPGLAGMGYFGAAVNPALGRLYVTNRLDNSVTVISLTTNQVLFSTTLPASPYCLAVNPYTGRVFVVSAQNDTVYVLDGTTLALLTTLPVGAQDPDHGGQGIAVLDNKVYVANYAAGTVTVIEDGAAPTPTATPTPTPVSNLVSITDAGFLPSLIIVPPGTTVQWVNNGTMTHTVTSDTGLWDSGPLAPGAGFARTFPDLGLYSYHCSLHPTMIGAVLVALETTPTPTATPTRTPTPGPTLTVGSVWRTNVTDVSFTISWVTNQPVTGSVRYGTSPGSLTAVANDVRGADTVDDTHYVMVFGSDILPTTTYYFVLESGGQTFDNGGVPYTVTTGPTLALPCGTDYAWGYVYKADGSTPAPGTIISLTIQHGGASSAPLSGLAESAGIWYSNIGNARTQDLSACFTYQPGGGSNVVIFAHGAAEGTASRVVDTAADKPVAPIVLNGVSSLGVSLAAGWNLVALPLDPGTSYTAQTLLDSINQQAARTVALEVDRWYAGGWQAHMNGLPFNDFPIEVGQAYFVRVTAPTVWTIPVRPVSSFGQTSIASLEAGDALSLKAGWNLISVPLGPDGQPRFYTASSLLQAINAQGGSVTQVVRWYAGGWQAYLAGLPLNDFPIQPGRGYFLRATAPSTWVP